MKLTAFLFGTSAFLTCVAASFSEALAQDFEVGNCYVRCSNAFSECFGTTDLGNPHTLPEIASNGLVLTPPSYEFCLSVKQACDATCNADFISSRIRKTE